MPTEPERPKCAATHRGMPYPCALERDHGGKHASQIGEVVVRWLPEDLEAKPDARTTK
ncbi:MAG TPA: hypothetical protein VGH28_13695 [Polyangiaceae bacterium]